MLGFETVPIIHEGVRLPETIEEIVKMADGKSALNPNFNREGLVFRTRGSKRISFKAISNLFLLGEKD